MAGRAGSTAFVMGFVAIVVLTVAGNGAAQLEPPQPIPSQPTSPAPPPVELPPPFPSRSVQRSVTAPPTQPPAFTMPQAVPRAPRFNIRIDPNTPPKELLPTPPKSTTCTGPLLTDDLTKVPEAQFQARPEKISPDEKLTQQTAEQLAKIGFLNTTKTDAFMATLLENRPDLAGLPFAMGDDCRTSGERTKQFTHAVTLVRELLSSTRAPRPPSTTTVPFLPTSGSGTPVQPTVSHMMHEPGFWELFADRCNLEDEARSKADKSLAEHATVARIAALMQMLAAESPELRLGLVKYLTGVPHVEATRALARLAIYSPEEEIHIAAIDSLKVRREKDYTDILVKGMSYPFPAVAKRSADAIARLGRGDLIPELVAVLEKEDPRMPYSKLAVEGKPSQGTFVREMVKVNHHRNCMMCHAPAETQIHRIHVPRDDAGGGPHLVQHVTLASTNALTVEVPIEGQPFPSGGGYQQSTPELMIRVDVTYLHQDFSATMSVGDAHPWPEMQRFDFLVRERKLTDAEADAYREKLTPKEAGVLSPYHRAALAALRELTGKDTNPTASAWRNLLGLQAKSSVVR